MYEYGKRSEMYGQEHLVDITDQIMVDAQGKPDSFPGLRHDHILIAGQDAGLGEFMTGCDTLEEMQQLWTHLSKGWINGLKWYAVKKWQIINVTAY